MKRLRRLRLAVLVVGALAFTDSRASQLLVEPIGLELTAPANAGTITLRNNEDTDISVQTRVFRWSQVDGKDRLEPTADVGASPPLVRLAPGANYTVRVVRTTKSPVVGEQSYRLLIDELPQAPLDMLHHNSTQGNVNLLVRQSVPVFFKGLRSSGPDVTWRVKLERDRIHVVASNRGDSRLRVASLKLHDPHGATLNFGNGLSGYVLGKSTKDLDSPIRNNIFGNETVLTVEAESNFGHVNASASVQTAS